MAMTTRLLFFTGWLFCAHWSSTARADNCWTVNFFWYCSDADSCRKELNCVDTLQCKQVPGRRYACFDVNECLEVGRCDSNAACHNYFGGFNCVCRTGFTGDGFGCTDVNECWSSGTCGTNADCENTIGSFNCVCRAGYSGDGFTCTDVDECRNSGTCDTNADCENTPGSFNCVCRAGYSGNGFTCRDVDECHGENSCHNAADCVNLPGGYNCTCRTGYKGNGSHCTDEDECENGDVCDSHADCANYDGGFNCSCRAGFLRDGFNCSAMEPMALGGSLSGSSVAGIVVGVSAALLLIALIAVFIIRRRRSHEHSKQEKTDPSRDQTYVNVTMSGLIQNSVTPSNGVDIADPTYEAVDNKVGSDNSVDEYLDQPMEGLDEEYSLAKEVDPGYSVAEKVDPGYSTAEKVDPGYSIAEKVDPGYSVAEEVDPGYSLAEKVDAIYSNEGQQTASKATRTDYDRLHAALDAPPYSVVESPPTSKAEIPSDVTVSDNSTEVYDHLKRAQDVKSIPTDPNKDYAHLYSRHIDS